MMRDVAQWERAARKHAERNARWIVVCCLLAGLLFRIGAMR